MILVKAQLLDSNHKSRQAVILVQAAETVGTTERGWKVQSFGHRN